MLADTKQNTLWEYANALLLKYVEYIVTNELPKVKNKDDMFNLV